MTIRSHRHPKSRPRVSDDNVYGESLFRTTQHWPEFPAKGFASLDKTRSWAAEFVRWDNVDHRHSGIRYVSPPATSCRSAYAVALIAESLLCPAGEAQPATAAPESSAQRVDAAINCCE